MGRRFRYTFILVLVAIGTCLAAVSGWRYARASAPVNGPILLVSIDSLRADRLGPYGYRQAKTPTIDTLAKDGVVFERAYSHVPETLPSHVSLLTGQLPFENGVRDGVGFTVPASERLLPAMLRDRGYATGGVVSSFLLRKQTGISQGFSFFDGEMPATSDGLRRDGSESERLAEHWLDSIGTTRAFLFLHLDEPRRVPGAAADVTEDPSYDARISRADEILGHLLRYLKTHQLYDQSTVILVSDHGEGLGEHGEQGHGLLIYDNTLRVPLIIKQPAGEGAGLRVKARVQLIDLVPTILDLAKAPRPGGLRGRSLTPLLHLGGSVAETSVYAESRFGLYHFGWSEVRSIVDGRYTYIEGATPELYDIETDPEQRENLADTRKDVAAGLRDKMRGFTSASSADLPVEAVDDLDRDRAAALGYVGVPPQPAPPRSESIDPRDHWEDVEQYRAAVALETAGDSDGAIEGFRTLARRDPDMRDVWMLLGRAAFRRERWEMSVDAYRHAIQLAPTELDAYVGSAEALLGLRRFEDAGTQARHVIEDPAAGPLLLSSGHEIVARAALGRRNLDLARSEAELAEANGRRPVKAYVEGRIAFDQRRFAEASESFQAAQAIVEKNQDPPLADLRLYAAESLLRLSRWSEAEPLFVAELKASPSSARARTGLTAVYRATGRGSEAAALAQH